MDVLELSMLDTVHTTDLKHRTRPVLYQPYCVGHKSREGPCEHVNKQLKAGLIEQVQSGWSTAIVVVPKRDDILQCFVDYCRFNAATIPDTYLLSLTDDSIYRIRGSRMFTAKDAL